jgi:hypothetical protein
LFINERVLIFGVVDLNLELVLYREETSTKKGKQHSTCGIDAQARMMT